MTHTAGGLRRHLASAAKGRRSAGPREDMWKNADLRRFSRGRETQELFLSCLRVLRQPQEAPPLSPLFSSPFLELEREESRRACSETEPPRGRAHGTDAQRGCEAARRTNDKQSTETATLPNAHRQPAASLRDASRPSFSPISRNLQLSRVAFPTFSRSCASVPVCRSSGSLPSSLPSSLLSSRPSSLSSLRVSGWPLRRRDVSTQRPRVSRLEEPAACLVSETPAVPASSPFLPSACSLLPPSSPALFVLRSASPSSPALPPALSSSALPPASSASSASAPLRSASRQSFATPMRPRTLHTLRAETRIPAASNPLGDGADTAFPVRPNFKGASAAPSPTRHAPGVGTGSGERERGPRRERSEVATDPNGGGEHQANQQENETEEAHEREEVIASRLSGSYAASSLPLADVSVTLSNAEELRVIEELETQERKAKATQIQAAMQRLCRLVISRSAAADGQEMTAHAMSQAAAPSHVEKLLLAEERAPESNDGSETDGEETREGNGCGAAERVADAEGKIQRSHGSRMQAETSKGQKREKELRRTHMRSQFGWISSAIDLQTLMNDAEFADAVHVLAAMECPVIIRTKKLHQQLVPLSHGSTARIRQASKKLREALGIPEVIVCRGCAKKSKCPIYRQPPLRLRSSEGRVTTKDLLYVLFGQYMVCRLYTRGVDSKTVWAESDERTAYSKILSVSLLPSTMNAHDLDMGLLAIEKLTERVAEKIQEERRKATRIAEAAQRAGLGDELQFNPLSLKAFRAFIEDGQARRSERQEKMKEARALKMPLWIRDSVRPLPETQLTKFQKKAIQFHRLAVDEPEPDCPVEERVVWVHESEDAGACEANDGDDETSQKTQEEEDAQKAIAAETDATFQALEPLVHLRERGQEGEAGVVLPSLEDLPIQRRFAWKSPDGFPLRQRTLRFNLLYHYYLDRLKSQASRIPRFDVSAKNEADRSATSSGAVFPEDRDGPEPPVLLPVPHGGYSAVPLSSFSSEDDTHPLLRVDPKSLKGVAVYRHLSVRQMVESQQRIDRLWRTAALFEDLPVIHRISAREELADQSSGDPASLLASLPRLPRNARAHLRELERAREEDRQKESLAEGDLRPAQGDARARRGFWEVRPPPDRTKLLENAPEERISGALSEGDTWSRRQGETKAGQTDAFGKRGKGSVLAGDKLHGAGREREREPDAGPTPKANSLQGAPLPAPASTGEVRCLSEALPEWLQREEERWRSEKALAVQSDATDEEGEDGRASAPRGARRARVGESKEDGNEKGPEAAELLRAREARETRDEEENDDALDEALFGEERRRSRELWRAARRDRTADARKQDIERAVQTPPSVDAIQAQAKSLRRAATDGDLGRARGRSRRRTVSEMLEDADADEKRFQRWQAARRQAQEGTAERAEASAAGFEQTTWGRGEREETETDFELSKRRAPHEPAHQQAHHVNLDQDEPFHMLDEGGGIRVSGTRGGDLRFAGSKYTVVDGTPATSRVPAEASASSFASSPASLPLLSPLDMHARAAGERQPSEDGRALQELDSLDETALEVFVKPGRLEKKVKGVRPQASRLDVREGAQGPSASEVPEEAPERIERLASRRQGEATGSRGSARQRKEASDGGDAVDAQYGASLRAGAGEEDARTQATRDDAETDEDAEDFVFRTNFRVPLESDGGRPLGVDREEVARSHMDMARMQKTWRQNEDFLITRNVLYPKFVDLSQDAYGAHSPEGKEARKQQLAANRANTRASSLGSPTRRMPVAGLIQATLPDVTGLMKKEGNAGEGKGEDAGRQKEESLRRRKRAGFSQEAEDEKRERAEAEEEASFRNKYGVVKDMAKVYNDRVKNNQMGGTVVNPVITELQRSETLNRLIQKKAAAREGRRRTHQTKAKAMAKSKLDEILRRPPVSSRTDA
uniref:Uncharacterized protein n=1 Tax=Neospora caninum (strain Liverpool) TaxID=572307 RepID=A0A0F7UD18_NEOCL|nr:TPA: hypothetical protein BN1204_035710 [Neospora caninum Liverpool]